MSLVYKNVEVTRNFFLKNVEAYNEAIVDVQPDGFNNTIHWHVGHVLTVTEQLMFGFPKKSTNLPANYMELFATGTKPSEWQGDVPSFKDLTSQLRDQLGRIKEIPEESLSERLKQPFLGLETFGELVNFAAFHESNHLGQIHAMKRVVEAAQSK